MDRETFKNYLGRLQGHLPTLYEMVLDEDALYDAYVDSCSVFERGIDEVCKIDLPHTSVGPLVFKTLLSDMTPRYGENLDCVGKLLALPSYLLLIDLILELKPPAPQTIVEEWCRKIWGITSTKLEDEVGEMIGIICIISKFESFCFLAKSMLLRGEEQTDSQAARHANHVLADYLRPNSVRHYTYWGRRRINYAELLLDSYTPRDLIQIPYDRYNPKPNIQLIGSVVHQMRKLGFLH